MKIIQRYINQGFDQREGLNQAVKGLYYELIINEEIAGSAWNAMENMQDTSFKPEKEILNQMIMTGRIFLLKSKFYEELLLYRLKLSEVESRYDQDSIKALGLQTTKLMKILVKHHKKSLPKGLIYDNGDLKK